MGLTKSDLVGLDRFHKKQFRQVLNMIYPNTIKNKDLYERTNQQPISLTILKNRWKLFRHTLRLNSEIPARKSILYYFTDSSKPKFSGRQRITLPIRTHNDICKAVTVNTLSNSHGITTCNSLSDLMLLINLADDRRKWRHITDEVFAAAPAEKLI